MELSVNYWIYSDAKETNHTVLQTGIVKILRRNLYTYVNRRHDFSNMLFDLLLDIFKYNPNEGGWVNSEFWLFKAIVAWTGPRNSSE